MLNINEYFLTNLVWCLSMTEFNLKEGLEGTRKYIVHEEHTAKFLGSGEVSVLSTPSMIAMMENTARLLVEGNLPEGYTTVGIHVDIRHLRAAPMGAEILVKAKLIEISGKKLKFAVEAFWGDKKIGEGIHERYIVNKEDFLKKVKQALNSS